MRNLKDIIKEGAPKKRDIVKIERFLSDTATVDEVHQYHLKQVIQDEMKQAVRILAKRIEECQNELRKVQVHLEEPELMHSYHFALTDEINLNAEILELREAIHFLLTK